MAEPALPISSRRRLVRAAIAMVLVILLGGGAVGLANAGNGSEVPATLGVAAPRSGDAWSYSATLTGHWTLGSNDTLRLGQEFPAFELRATTTTIRLADGLVHDATRVDVHGLHYFPLMAQFDLEPQAHQAWSVRSGTTWFGIAGAIADESNGPMGSAQGSAGCNGSPLCSSLGSAVQVSARERTFGADEACLVRNLLQDAKMPTRGTHELFPTCSLGGSLLRLDGNTTFSAQAVEQVSGMAAVRYEATDDSGLTAWLNPGIPYPVQVAQSIDGHNVVLRLTGFHAGSEPWTTSDHPREPAPALVWADAQPWGPDDAGLTIPFGLSQAFELARTDASFHGLQDFVTQHPAARATQASLTIIQRETRYATFAQPDGTDRTWSITLSDGTACFSLESMQQQRPAALPAPLGGPQTTYAFSGGEKGCKPLAPPARWPTAASATALWQAYARPSEIEQGANGVAFRVTSKGVVSLEAGQAADAGQEITDRGVGTATSGTSASAGARLALADGKVDEYVAYEPTFSSYSEFAGMRSEEGTPAQASAPIAPASHGITAALAMPVTTAAGIGLLAVLVGAATWAWRLPVAGLFSRVHGHRLLEHPVRADLTLRIEASPGIHYQELVRATGLGKGAVEHHLRKLEGSGLIKVLRTSGYTCYFPTNVPAPMRPAVPALKSDGARRVLEAIRARPGISGREVTLCTGLAAGTVSEHVSRLAAVGLVDSARDGRVVRLRATALAEKAAASSSAA